MASQGAHHVVDAHPWPPGGVAMVPAGCLQHAHISSAARLGRQPDKRREAVKKGEVAREHPGQQLSQGAYAMNPSTFASDDWFSLCTLSGQWKAHRGEGLATVMTVVRIAAHSLPF